uniref:KASH domain-containing protein n=1 Tax=Caenorhabditis tropicalis TaxID=1561998 RepID=A0A1I7T101_9PELO
TKRAELEQAIKDKADEKSLHDAVDRSVSRLVPLVRDAEELRHNAEAVPTQYAPKAEELKKEVEAAKAIIANAPASDAHVQQLQQAVASAESLIPDLEERARLWDEFLVARNDIDALIERLQQPLEAVVAKPKRSAGEAAQDVDNLRQSAQQLSDLDNKIANLQRISELLDPLESAYADVRFFDVDAEQTRHQYDDVLNDVAAELEDETLLKQSADQVAKEIDDISKMIDSTDPERSILDTIAKSDVPALKAQINRIKDRIVNADASRKHVTTDPKIADDLDNKLAKLEAELDDAIKTSDEHDKEQLILSLKLNISQFEQLPLDQLKPDDLKTAEKEITNSLKPEEAEPLLAKIQELRDAKKADDEARSAAHDNLVTLEKQAEDVTAKESAKKKKKDKKKSPQEMIDELKAKVVEAKELIPKIEEAAKNEHLPADDKPKAEQLVSNLETFIKDVETQVSEKQDELDKLNNASDAIRRLGDALDDAEKTVVPSNVAALKEFKDRIAPHLATLLKLSKRLLSSNSPNWPSLATRSIHKLPRTSRIPRPRLKNCFRLSKKPFHRRMLFVVNKPRSMIVSTVSRESWANVDEFKPEDALPIVDKLATDTTALKAVTDSNNEKAVTPSSLISHEDLVAGLPEKVFQLQHAIDDKKQALNKTAAVNEIAPKLQLVSQQLQSVPQEVPASLDEQKQLLEEAEEPVGLSRLKDLLKQLGSAVGDKLAALAAFNAARKNAEDALLDITREDGADDSKSPDELIDDLTKKEETVAKLRETVAGVKPDELDEKGTGRTKRAELEQAIKDKADEKSLHDAVDRSVSRLVPLVRDAEELRHNAEAVPTQYAPKAEELKKEVEAAKAIIANAPASDAHVQQLQQAVASAESLIPDLEERTSIWERFIKSKDDLYDDLEKLENTVSDVLNRPRLPVSQAQQRLNKLKEQFYLLDRIRNSKIDFDDLGEALLPLTVVEDELRFMHVHVESIERQYEDTMDKLNAEITAEIELLRTLDILSNELSQCKEDINNPTTDVDELSRVTMLKDAIAHLENQKVVVERSEKDRKFVESSTSTDLDQLLVEAKRLLREIEPRLQLAQPDHDNEDEEDEEKGSEEKPYDVRAAAEVLSALYPDEHPHNVLRNIGFEELPSDSESRSEFDSLDSRSDGLLSPIPDDSTLNEEQLRRQRSRWRRVLRTALPLQALLVLLMGAACLVPHCDDEYCCQLLNNFAKSFDPSLEFVNGPPPF